MTQNENKRKINLLITGLSKTGKTYSSHLIAQGIGGKVLYIDTENRAEFTGKHIGVSNFTYVCLTNPSIEEFTFAYNKAKKEGFDTVVIDSATAEYEDYLRRGYESDPEKFTYSNKWGLKHKEFIKTISMDGEINTVVTARAEMMQDANKKSFLKTIQDKVFKNEFLMVWELDEDGNAKVSADGTFIMEPKSVFKITQETGKTLKLGMEKLNERVQQQQESQGSTATLGFSKIDQARELLTHVGLDETQFCKFNGLKDLSEMTDQQYFNLVQNHGGQ